MLQRAVQEALYYAELLSLLNRYEAGWLACQAIRSRLLRLDVLQGSLQSLQGCLEFLQHQDFIVMMEDQAYPDLYNFLGLR